MFEYPCKIVKVIDGDTADVDIDLGFGVWLNKEEKVYGIMAKDFVKSYIPKGSSQVLRTHKDGKGKYGRILGEFVVFDGATDRETTVNQLLIDTHNAVAYFGQSKDDIAEEHLKNRDLVEVSNSTVSNLIKSEE